MPRIVVALLLLLLPSAARADDYPQHTVTFICPFPAGGGTDILTRMLAAELQEKLKQPFIVENRTGAGTQIAASAVAKSLPDGHTLLLAPVTTLAIGPSVYKALPYDTVRDFAPVGLVGAAEFALVAHPSLGARTLPELIALIKSRPGALSYGSAGRSTPHHLFMEMFLKMIGGQVQHVPYRGSVPALADVVAGQVQLMMVDLAAAILDRRRQSLLAQGHPAAGRVEQTHAFIRKLAISDVAVRELDRLGNSFVQNADLVMFLQRVRQAAHHSHGFGLVGFVDLDDLEAAL